LSPEFPEVVIHEGSHDVALNTGRGRLRLRSKVNRLKVTGSLRIFKGGQGSSGSQWVPARIDLNITFYIALIKLNLNFVELLDH
jgi:hypothetical protein